MEIQKDEPASRPLVGIAHGRARLVTPALLFDLDVPERNLRLVVQTAVAAGMALRPHVKGHKCLELARLQLAAGVAGLACATLAEAELMAASGARSLLLTSPVVDPVKIERLAALNERVPELIVVTDCPLGLPLLERAATVRPLSVLIDLDVGQQRTCIPVAALDRVLALRAAIEATPGLRFTGLQAYYGHLEGLLDFAECAAKANAQQRLVKAVVAALAAEDARPTVVSGGGTGTLLVDGDAGLFTELQPGSCPFLDRQYGREELTPDGRPWLEPALFVASRVISVGQPDRVTVDAGTKAITTDGGPASLSRPAGIAAEYVFAGDEHGFLLLEPSNPKPRLGDIVELQPGHVVRGETLEAIWPIDARSLVGCKPCLIQMLSVRPSFGSARGARVLDVREFAAIGDTAGAYAIQRAVAWRATPLLGPVAGYKIGMSTTVAQLQHGLDGPLMGRVYRRQLLASGAALDVGALVRLGLEVEVGIEIGLDLAPSGGPVTAARAAVAIAACHVAIELLEDRFEPAIEPSLWMRAADDMLGRGGVIGEALPAFDPTLAHDGSLAVDGTVRARGSTADLAGGGPLPGLALLANCLAEQGSMLRRGDVVFSGGLNPPLWLEPDPGGIAAIEARIDDGPCATFEISWTA